MAKQIEPLGRITRQNHERFRDDARARAAEETGSAWRAAYTRIAEAHEEAVRLHLADEAEAARQAEANARTGFAQVFPTESELARLLELAQAGADGVPVTAETFADQVWRELVARAEAHPLKTETRRKWPWQKG